jgi:hypothetical protein
MYKRSRKDTEERKFEDFMMFYTDQVESQGMHASLGIHSVTSL